MADPSRYPIPAERARAEVVIERSRFLCTLAPVATPADAEAVQVALDRLVTRERVEYAAFTVAVTYAQFSAVQHLLATYEAEALSESFAENVTLLLRAPVQRVPALRAAIGNATHGQAMFTHDVTPIG